MLLCLAACDGGGTPEPPPADEEPPESAASMYLSLREKVNAVGGRLCVRASSYLQIDNAALRVELYAATDGEGVYQSTDFSTDGKWMLTSHAYTNGILRVNDTATPITAAEYRALYGFPSIPELDAANLLSLSVHKELDGYCFTVSEAATSNTSFLQGMMGRDLYVLYVQAKAETVFYTFHFDKEGNLDHLDVRLEMLVEGNLVSLTSTVRYADFGTAYPIPPA